MFAPQSDGPAKGDCLLLRRFPTRVHSICFRSSKTQLPEGCCQDPCDIFTNRCVRVMEFLDVMVSKCDLAKQSVELSHSLSLKTGIFQRVLTSPKP